MVMVTAWYLRSYRDEDTHRGRLNGEGKVSAMCGATFAPVRNPLDGTTALPGYPPDPGQVCPDCHQESG